MGDIALTDPHFEHRGIRESSYYELTRAYGTLINRANRTVQGSAERKAINRWLNAVHAEQKGRDSASSPLTEYVLSFE